MHRKLTALLAAGAFALAACDSTTDDRGAATPDATPDAVHADVIAAPGEPPSPPSATPMDTAAGDAPVDEDAALQAAYDEGKAAAAQAIDAAGE